MNPFVSAELAALRGDALDRQADQARRTHRRPPLQTRVFRRNRRGGEGA
jgi:hypothetical protein